MLSHYMKVSQHFPYRTANPVDVVCDFQYKDNDDWDLIHHQCADQASQFYTYRKHPDNHEMFEVSNTKGNKLYLYFSDWQVYISFSYYLTNK
jgi:hypothetical protein